MSNFVDNLERFAGPLFAQEPELGEIVLLFRSGEIDEKEAIKRVYGIAARRPEFQQHIEDAVFKAFEVDPESTDLAHFPAREEMLDRWGFTEEDLVYKPFPDRPNYAMLHPLLMGMIAELLQYDGDIPELRTGQLPEGGAPAVPVLTHARDPVMIGALLKVASEEVASELMLAQADHNAKIAGVIEAVGGQSVGTSIKIRRETERGIAVSGYSPGKKAQLRKVEAPAAVEVAQMSFKDRQALAHKALTSTQGRRSAVPVISGMIMDALHQEGYNGLSVGTEGSVVAEVEWVMMIDGGQNERNPNFNFIDTAARSLTAKLRRELPQVTRGAEMCLAISPVNNIADRRVGWRATLSA